jgi:hypothetical protein
MKRTSAITALCLAAGIAAALPAADLLHWSFLSLKSPEVPVEVDSAWASSPIDTFILQRLHQESVEPSPDADRRTLIRRATLDLIGLPPSPDEVADFLADDRPDAYERWVDRLLASPHYGERWTRNWLDLCHYGDSDGHLTDQLRPVAWRYRDWVCHSLNRNLPFDEFTLCQLAGDLVEGAAGEPSPVLGTGFLRQTLSNREGGADLEEYRVEQVVDRTSMVGAIWLGLTVGCARCHDHKYDPLTQEEFFRLYAYFDQADEINIDAPLPQEVAAYQAARPQFERCRRDVIEPYRAALDDLQQCWEAKLLHALAHPGEDHVWDRQWELLGLIWGGNLGEGQLEGTEIVKRPWEKRAQREQDDLLDFFLQHGAIVDEKQFADSKLSELRDALAKLKQEHPAAHCTRAPVMRTALTPRATFLHERGDFRDPGVKVEPALPKWLPGPGAEPQSRLTLARWLVSPDNPLTPRVTVNRAWQEFFGRGLVATEDDFGLRGEIPSHPGLLDWLARELLRGGWDVKQLHRSIAGSATYRQSSQPRPELAKRDPDNIWLARQNSLRISAESVRDSALAASGLLCGRVGGPSVFPPQPDRVTMEAFGNNAWKPSAGGDRYRRGLYTFILRTSPFAQAITFDAPSPQQLCTRRDRSNTPLQALSLLNDPMFYELSAGLADRLRSEAGNNDDRRLQRAFEICLSRPANHAEIERLRTHLAQSRSAENGQRSEAEVWTELASVMFNLHEFITRD